MTKESNLNSNKMAYKNAIRELAVALDALRSDPARLLFICPHVRADGDALGAALALQEGLNKLGVDNLVLLSEPVSQTFAYMAFGDNVRVLGSEENVDEFLRNIPDDRKLTGFMIDCSGLERLGARARIFDILETQDIFVLDHHISDMEQSSQVLIRPESAATCELAADLITAWETLTDLTILNHQIATALYTGLLTDTGRFTYRATTSNTLYVAGRLLEEDVDTQFLSSHLFDTQTLGLLRLRCYLAQRLEFISDGRGVMAKITGEQLEACGATREELEAIPSWMREIEGVEASILVRDLGDGAVRGNLRSLPPLKIEPLARIFGGGGHAQASGFTVEDGALDEVYDLVKAEAEKLLTENVKNG